MGLPYDVKKVRRDIARTCRTGRQQSAEGVRFSRVFDRGVKRWLTKLNAGCQGVGNLPRERGEQNKRIRRQGFSFEHVGVRNEMTAK